MAVRCAYGEEKKYMVAKVAVKIVQGGVAPTLPQVVLHGQDILKLEELQHAVERVGKEETYLVT